MKQLAISTLLLLSLTACSKSPIIEVTQSYKLCPKATKGQTVYLDESKHIAHPDNVNKLMEIIDTNYLYIQRLSNEIDCYKAQAEGLK